jgi:hypothetical protein
MHFVVVNNGKEFLGVVDGNAITVVGSNLQYSRAIAGLACFSRAAAKECLRGRKPGDLKRNST